MSGIVEYNVRIIIEVVIELIQYPFWKFQTNSCRPKTSFQERSDGGISSYVPPEFYTSPKQIFGYVPDCGFSAGMCDPLNPAADCEIYVVDQSLRSTVRPATTPA